MTTTFAGTLFLPGSEMYDTERLPWNRRLDPRPAIVAAAATPADVVLAVRLARGRDLGVAVQATGHGAVRPADGGLLITTSRLASVRVNPERRTAVVGAGTRWAEVVAAAAPYGLAPLSGTASVGVTGYTLGGGAGWLSRRYGYAADSLLRAELVTATGERCTAGADEHPDLFWALRGGSGNFGVATELEFRLYPVPRVTAGMSLHPVANARRTLAAYRDWAPTEPDELNTAVVLLTMPDTPAVPEPVRGRRVLGVRACFLGTEARARGLLAPLRAAAGPALVDTLAEGDFAAASATLSGQPAPPTAVRQHVEMYRSLHDEVLDAVVDTDASIEVRH